MIQSLAFVLRFTAHMDAQPFQTAFVLVAGDGGEMHVASLEFRQLLDSHLCERVRERRDRQGDQNLIGVESGVSVVEILRLQCADGLQHLCGDQIKMIRNISKGFQSIQKQR